MRNLAKYAVMTLLITAIALGMAGCKENEDAYVSTTRPASPLQADSPSPEAVLTEPPAQPAESQMDPEAVFMEILSGEGMFYSTGYQKELTLQDYLNVFSAQTGTQASVPQYTILDMDSDGVPELLLWLRLGEYHDYGTLLLHRNKDRWEEHTFSYRQMFDLKADGSFAVSGSDADGYAMLLFIGTGWQYLEISGEGQEEKESARWVTFGS